MSIGLVSQRMLWVLLCLAMGGGGVAFGELPKGLKADDVLFYASYDKDEAADVAKGQAKPVENAGHSLAVPGRVGQAREFKYEGIYSAAKNIRAEAGTVAFWFCPRWEPADGKHHSLFDWRVGTHAYDRLLVYKYVSNDIFFGVRSKKGTKMMRKLAATSPVKGWKPGEWHHIVVTWDTASAALHLYVDGEHRAKSIKKAWEFGTMPVRFRVGSTKTLMDELVVLKRPLTAEEAKTLHSTSAPLK